MRSELNPSSSADCSIRSRIRSSVGAATAVTSMGANEIVTPLSSIPTFVGLTGDIAPRVRRGMITQTSVTVFAILVVSYLTYSILLPPFLYAFFGMFVGTIQAFVFTMLTVVYISVQVK